MISVTQQKSSKRSLKKVPRTPLSEDCLGHMSENKNLYCLDQCSQKFAHFGPIPARYPALKLFCKKNIL